MAAAVAPRPAAASSAGSSPSAPDTPNPTVVSAAAGEALSSVLASAPSGGVRVVVADEDDSAGDELSGCKDAIERRSAVKLFCQCCCPPAGGPCSARKRTRRTLVQVRFSQLLVTLQLATQSSTGRGEGTDGLLGYSSPPSSMDRSAPRPESAGISVRFPRSRLVVAGFLVSLVLWLACATTAAAQSSLQTNPPTVGSGGERERPPTSASRPGAGDEGSSNDSSMGRAEVERNRTRLGQPSRRRRNLPRAAAPAPPFPTVIALTAGLPVAGSLSTPFAAALDNTLQALSTRIESLTAQALSPEHAARLVGVPGTAISSAAEAADLQAYLDCVSSTGEWVRDPHGAGLAAAGGGLTVHKQESRHAACDKRFYKGDQKPDSRVSWDVRESLKWTWRPAKRCDKLAPTSSQRTAAARTNRALLPSRRRLCELLEHKSTLLLGDTTQYSLHDLVLDWTTLKPQSCYGDLYCKQHLLCDEILARPRDDKDVEQGRADTKVYRQLPLPPPPTRRERDLGARASLPEDVAAEAAADDFDGTLPQEQPLARRAGSERRGDTLLRYRRTDGLRPFWTQNRPQYRAPSTDVREVNQQWLAETRWFDLVVLNKAPLPLPRVGFNATFDAWVREYVEDPARGVKDRARRILESARWVTEEVWLPELVEALSAIRTPPKPVDQLVLYRGGWRQHADCAASELPDEEAELFPPTSPGDGPPPHVSPPTLASLLLRRRRSTFSDVNSDDNGGSTLELQSLHIAYHNAQLLLQNHLARRIVLPAFGIPFLDLETPLSVWRSGMVGSSVASPFQAFVDAQQRQTVLAAGGAAAAGHGLRSPASGDCTRYCFPSPGLALERFFLGSMATVLEAGWAGDKGREREWVGERFTTLRDRVARKG